MPNPTQPLSIITSFLSNLTIELLAEKIFSWLAGLGDADKKNLNQTFKAISSDLAPAQQKQLKKLDEAKINIFKAAFNPDSSKILTASRDGTVKLWLTPKEIYKWLQTYPIYRLSEKGEKGVWVIE